MARLQIHPVGLAVVIFGFLVWVIALGGCGAASWSCREHNSYEDCALTYQWEWFTVWFEFALLLALFVSSFLERAFRHGRLVFVAFFVLCTQCVMLSAHNFITQLQLSDSIDVKNLSQDATNAASAGFVLLGIANFALIIVLGKDFGVAPAAPPHQYQHPSAGMQFQTSAPV